MRNDKDKIEAFRWDETLSLGMSRAGYDDIAKHRQDHEVFLRQFEIRKSGLQAGKPNAGNVIFEFCSEWLKEHIQRDDRAFADYLSQRKAA
jgi:hemerythrin